MAKQNNASGPGNVKAPGPAVKTVKTPTGTINYDKNGLKISVTGKPPKSTGNTGTVTRTITVQHPTNKYASKGVKVSANSTAKIPSKMTSDEFDKASRKGLFRVVK